MTAPGSYADGGSSTESEDEGNFMPQRQLKRERPTEVAASPVVAVAAAPAPGSNNIMDILALAPTPPAAEPETEAGADAVAVAVASHAASVDTPSEVEVVDLSAEDEPVKPEQAPRPTNCSSCRYPLLVVPQHEMVAAKQRLDCSCCLLLLPSSSFSKSQRSGNHKCKACTGNASKEQAPRATATGSVASAPVQQSVRAKKLSQEKLEVFTNKVGRLKCAQRALHRKRQDAHKLRGSTREDYELQLKREEKMLDRQATLLRVEDAALYDQLQGDIKIKRPLGIPRSERDHQPKKRAKTAEQKRKDAEQKKWRDSKIEAKRKKMEEKRQAAGKKRKGPSVDPSTYVPPPSTAQEVTPARTIPTRARTRAQLQLQQEQVKPEIKGE